MAKIGVFDSGVGGVTVLKEINRILPKESVIYYGDNKHAPYGERTIENIRMLCLNIGDFLVKNKVDAIVIACNTATAASLDALKERFSNIPIIGVIEAGAKVATESTKNNNVGIFATPATVAMNAYPKAIKDLDMEISVSQAGCVEFCPMIEAGWEDIPENELIVKKYINSIPEETDTLVLGCTHYPIIKNIIARNFNGAVVDPSIETALLLKKELYLNGVKMDQDNCGHNEFYVSGDPDKFKKVAEMVLGEEIPKIYTLEV